MSERIQQEIGESQAKEVVHETSLVELVQEVTDDPELLQFFSENSEYPLNLDGTSSIARDPFQLVSHIARHSEEKAHMLVDLLAEKGFLPELHYEYNSEGINETELTHKLNLNRFESARENFYSHEHSDLEKAMVSRSMAYLESIRASFNLRKLSDIEQYITIKTEPMHMKSEGIGIVFPETPTVIVDTPTDISTLKFTFHELTHISAYTMCTFSKDEDGDISSAFSNVGVSTMRNFDKKGAGIYGFRNLNEAITEEFSKRFIQSLQDDDLDFAEILKDQKSKITKYRETHPTEFSEDEWHDVVAIHELPDGTQYPVQYTYIEERKMLKQLLTEMAQRLNSEYPNMSKGAIEEQLFQLLIKASFTGNLNDFKNAFIRAFGEKAYDLYISSTTSESDAEILKSIGVPGLENLFSNTGEKRFKGNIAG